MSTKLHPRGLGIQAAQSYLMSINAKTNQETLVALAEYGTRPAVFPRLSTLNLPPIKKKRVKNVLGKPLPSLSL